MAMRWRQLLYTVLLFCVLVDQAHLRKAVVEDEPPVSGGGDGKPPVPVIDCAGLCGVRCSRHSRPNLCKRACGTCCFRCKCVPPGTSGNREMCGACYTNMTTHGNRTKCP
ncbi:gibberellin-regulated protein 3-like [Musa acuminata AAA Group]|uniref:gibberellin-regulated protein 3-like n=1 Tax=Musa acuminata AAA Group TaxID=214697 RepID=UPI0031D8469D